MIFAEERGGEYQWRNVTMTVLKSLLGGCEIECLMLNHDCEKQFSPVCHSINLLLVTS